MGRSTRTDCYLITLPLPLTLDALPAPVEVSLLVCISSPIYLRAVSQSSQWRCGEYIRLEKLVAALELLVFVLDNLDAVDNLHEAGLEGFCLSSETVSLVRAGTKVKNAHTNERGSTVGDSDTEGGRSVACHVRGDAGLSYLLYQSLASILAHLLNLFATPARAHGARIAVVVLLLFLLHLDVGTVAGYYDGAARLSAP